MTTLRCPENISGAPDLKISHRNSESCAEPGILFNRVNTSPSRSHRHHISRKQKISIGLVLSSADPSTQLVQVGQTEPVCAVNDDGVGIRNVQTTFNDGGGN